LHVHLDGMSIAVDEYAPRASPDYKSSTITDVSGWKRLQLDVKLGAPTTFSFALDGNVLLARSVVTRQTLPVGMRRLGVGVNYVASLPTGVTEFAIDQLAASWK